MSINDTIAAIATPPGRGGVCIIRVSGPEATDIARQLLGECPKARHAGFYAFRNPDGHLIDEGLAIYFPSPRSFTGEDVLELHGHGGVVVSDMILQAALLAGARMARPGEFSERAFLNHKLDLTQAEAVADLIDAGSQRAVKAALRTLEGEFSRRVQGLLQELIELRVYIESSLDFADEEIELLQDGDVENRLDNLRQQVEGVLRSAHRGRVLSEGLQVVIAGHPNAGKSSLMNALSGRDSAIVTNIPGTTRDVIREQLVIEGIPVYLHDTAGLRDDAEEVEQEGIKRAKVSLANADLILWVHDDSAPLDETAFDLYRGHQFVLIHNKIDISGNPPGVWPDNNHLRLGLSTKTGDGLEQLRKVIAKHADIQSNDENDFAARRRHISALQQAQSRLLQAQSVLQQQLAQNGGGELLAEELRQAQRFLNEVTGEFSADDLLGKIFSEFCIGK